MNELELPGLDGANPLGFLAALGTLAVLSESDPSIKLGWQSGARWTPLLAGNPLDKADVLRLLTARLRGKAVDAEKERLRDEAQKRFDLAKKELKNALDDFKKRGLRGKERDTAKQRDIVPYERARDTARTELLTALKHAVPSAELALGQRPDCTIEEFRQHARILRGESETRTRSTADLLASFGAELSDNAEDRILPTPFCFITGSGHQWFLDTARQLMEKASETKLREALFEPWTYSDEKLTMRWDPLDDRRYALMDRDPTASDNKSATVWMANLLAYHALTFFPCATGGHRLIAAGWAYDGKLERFTWPLWRQFLSVHALRSLLLHPAFGQASIRPYRHELHTRGVAAILCARRIQVGNPPLHKINFSPASAL